MHKLDGGGIGRVSGPARKESPIESAETCQKKVSDFFSNNVLPSAADIKMPSQLSIFTVIHRQVTVGVSARRSQCDYYPSLKRKLG